MTTKRTAAGAEATLDASNVEILNAVRAAASTDYRDRVPTATRANIAKTAKLIHEYQPLWNEFYTTLLDRIGLTVFNNNQFKNRLAPFKKSLSYGAMVQESSANLITAESYNEEKNVDPFAAQKPELFTDYHVKNRADTYGIRINEALLYEAVLSEGELSAYLNGIYRLPSQSAEWDEYCIMRDLFGVAQQASPFYNVQVKDLATSSDKEADAKALVTAIRTMYLTAKGFYSRDFNAAGVDAAANDFILLTTPSVSATNDVYSLAAAFNMERAEWFADRVVVIDEFPAGLEGTQALLVDEDAFQCYDILNKSASIYNPRNDSLYQYLHARGIYSLSRQRPIIRFSTAASTGGTLTSKTVTNVALTAEPASMVDTADEMTYQMKPVVTYSDSSTDDNAYGIIIAATPSAYGAGNYTTILPDTGTYIDRNNVLHVSKSWANAVKYTSIVVVYIATLDPTKLARLSLTEPGE